MPRGVKGSGKAKHRPTRAVPPQASQQQPPQAQAAAAEPPRRVSPLAPDNPPPLASVDVDSLAGAALKEYARRAGVPARDIQNLTEDRLRQNVKLTITRHFELITDEA